MTQKKVIIYLYNRLNDPLIQSNLFLYINELNKKGIYKFTVVTYESIAQNSYENTNYTLTPQEIKQNESALNDQDIDWVRLEWFSGKSLYNKLKCFLNGFKEIKKLKKQGYDHIVALGTVAGSFAYLFSKFLNIHLYLYQYEPHSEYTYDVGYWSKSSLGFQMLNRLEKRSAHSAKVISSGTKHMENRLKNWKTKAAFFKIPSVVNQEKFQYSIEKSNYIRDKYSIPRDKKVILYAGKFAGLYFNEENPRMFSYLRNFSKDFHILIVTLNPIEEIKELFKNEGITQNLTVTSSSYEDIDKYLSAADFGTVSVESGPSKQFVSNIKVGEYLSCGLPYLICRGISEDDWYAENKGVGVVVKDFSEKEINQAYPKIQAYLDKDPQSLKEHCRKIGIEYRGFVNLYPRFEQAMKSLTS